MRKSMVICAPVSSVSGYGEHARDLVSSYIEHDKYDVKIIDVPWGDCPRNALKLNNEIHKKMINRILPQPVQITQQPDIYVDIRIPNEFQQIGKFNIGVTAGIETNAVSQAWLDGCNKMDLIIVPSEHSKEGFVNSAYDKLQQLPNGQQQKIGQLKLEKPIEVLFEGADETIWKSLETKEIDTEFFDWLNNEVPERFAFLHVGMWGKGGYGEDRKDIGKLVKVFYESFANKKKQPALILKTSGASFSVIDREVCLQRIKDIKSMFPSDWKLPNVYLLHGELSPTEMNYLYNHPKIKAMVSFTHGEGFGRPLLEATMTGLPVMATGWSGHVDFLNPNLSLLLPGELQKVPESAHWENIIIPESQWFVVDENSAYKGLNFLFDDVQRWKRNAKQLQEINTSKFTLNKMTVELDNLMEKYKSNIPSQVSLKLPKLKKVKDSEKSEIQLEQLLFDLTNNKKGLEIGGPSPLNHGEEQILYRNAETIDNVIFSDDTVWSKHPDKKYRYSDGKVGEVIINDGTDISDVSDNTYDFLFASHTLEHIANPLKALEEWKRVLKDDGNLILILPEKSLCFDHKRNISKFDTILSQYEKNVGEDDLSTLPEILENHDLSMDKPAGTFEQFKERSLKNYENRCLHHYVYNAELLKEMCSFLDCEFVYTITKGIDIWFVMKKKVKSTNQSEVKIPKLKKVEEIV